KPLLSKLTERAAGGESVVVLGPRYCSKRFVLNHLAHELQRRGADRIVRVCEIGESVVETEESLRTLLCAAVTSGQEVPPYGNIFDAVDALCESSPSQHVYLLVANVDGMAHHLARTFLQGIRTRVQAGKIVAILSGEYHFRDLVHGP